MPEIAKNYRGNSGVWIRDFRARPPRIPLPRLHKNAHLGGRLSGGEMGIPYWATPAGRPFRPAAVCARPFAFGEPVRHHSGLVHSYFSITLDV
jgi:hypothetical protein